MMKVEWSEQAVAEQHGHSRLKGMAKDRVIAVVMASLAFWVLQSGNFAVSQPMPPARDQNALPAESPAPGSYYVQVSSQRIEADAQRSYAALQARFPSLLRARAPVIRKGELNLANGRSVFYRVGVGPFSTAEDATQFCGRLRTAGAPCVVSKAGYWNTGD
jgi:cell division septation protein DedD